MTYKHGRNLCLPYVETADNTDSRQAAKGRTVHWH